MVIKYVNPHHHYYHFFFIIFIFYLLSFSANKYLTIYAKVFLVISTMYSTAFLIQGSFLNNWDKTYDLV